MSDSQCNQDEEEGSNSQLQTHRTSIVDEFVSIIDVPSDYNEKYNALNDAKKRDLYLGLWKKIADNVKANDIDTLKVFTEAVSLVNKTEKNKELLKTYRDNDSNSFKCKDFIRNVKMAIFGTVKEAFSCAIRSNNVDVLEILLKAENPSQDFDKILSKYYQKLKLRNVEIVEKVQIYVENRLIRGRFYRCISEANNEAMSGVKSADDNVPECIRQRLNVLLTAADRFMKCANSTIRANWFGCIARFIAQNIRVLKQQLKSTYTQLPWEEMEFCLIRFSFLCSIQRKNVIDHLTDFVEKLKDIFNYGNDVNDNTQNVTCKITEYMEMDKPNNREKISGFESLYIDYELMKDEYSLNKMLRYIKLALSVEPEEQSGRTIIQRALHVIGEYVKDRPTSPHLSETIQDTLMQEKLDAMIDVAPSLRDALSHSEKLHVLFLRNSIFNEDGFFTKIQSDLKKIEYVFRQVSYKVKIKQIKKWIKDIRICKKQDIEHFDELIRAFENMKFVDVDNRQVDVLNNIDKLVTKVRGIVVPTTESGTLFELFTEIERIVETERCNIANSTVHYNKLHEEIIKILHGILYELRVTTEQYNVQLSQNTVETLIMSFLDRFFWMSALKSEELWEVVDTTKLISDNTKEHAEFKNIQALLDEIDHTFFMESSLSKAIEAFNEKLDTSEPDNFVQDETTKKELDDLFRTIMIEIKSEETSKKLKSSLEELKSVNEITSKLNLDFERNKYKLSEEELEFLHKKLRATKAKGKKSLERPVDLYGEFLAGKRESNKFLGSLLLGTEEKSKIIAVFEEEEGKHGDDIESRLKKTIERSKQLLTDSQYYKLHTNFEIRVRDHEARNTLNKFFCSDDDMTENEYKELVECVKTTDAAKKKLITVYSSLNIASVASSLNDPYGALLNAIRKKESTAIEICKSLVNLVKSLDLDEDSKELLKRRIIGDRVFKTLEDCFHENLKLLSNTLGSVETPESQNSLILRYKYEENLQAEVEMLLFNLCEISITIDSLSSKFMAKTSQIPLQCMANGFLQLEGDMPFLRGKSLRNYLAHGDFLIDSLFMNSTTVVISSAIIFSQESEPLISLNKLVKDNKMKEILMKQVGEEVTQINPKELSTNLQQHKETLRNFYKSRHSKDYLASIFKEPKMKQKLSKVGTFDVNSPLRSLNRSVFGQIQLFNEINDGNRERLEHLQLLGHTTPIYAREDKNRTLLHVAAAAGHVDIVQILLDIGIKVEAVDKFGQTALHCAAYKGHHLVVNKLLEHNAGVMDVDLDKMTPLHLAAINGDAEVVKTLLKFRVNVEARNNINFIPLHYAAGFGRLDVVKLLVKDKPASVNIHNTEGLKPLHSAAMGKHDNVEVIEYLIKTGDAGVDPRNFEDTPLYLAAWRGNVNVFKFLFKKEVGNKEKNILLIAAATSGEAEIVRILLDNEANVNAVDNDGYTALHYAAFHGYNRVIRCLLERDAELGIPNKGGRIPLHGAAANGHLVAVKSLIKKGKSDINAKDNNGATPLHIAALFNNLEVIKFLLYSQACVNSRNKYGKTPLSYCVSTGCCDLKVAAYLIKKKADINVQSSFGLTLLHSAVMRGVLNIVKYLIDMKVSADTPDNSGRTVLHYAAATGYLDIVKFLVDKTNINATSSDKYTALHEAIIFGNNRVVRCLLENGACIEADVDNIKNNCIHLAALRGRLNVLKTLLEYKHDVKFIDAHNMNQETPLWLATLREFSGIVEILLDSGANVGTNRKALFKAVELGFVSIVKIFLKHGADSNLRSNEEGSLLHCAAKHGHDEIVTTLLNFGADINAPECNRCTPLHFATSAGHKNVVQVLLSRGARVDLRNNEEYTPLMIAKEGGLMDIAELLLEKKEMLHSSQCEERVDVLKSEPSTSKGAIR